VDFILDRPLLYRCHTSSIRIDDYLSSNSIGFSYNRIIAIRCYHFNDQHKINSKTGEVNHREK